MANTLPGLIIANIWWEFPIEDKPDYVYNPGISKWELVPPAATTDWKLIDRIAVDAIKTEYDAESAVVGAAIHVALYYNPCDTTRLKISGDDDECRGLFYIEIWEVAEPPKAETALTFRVPGILKES